ncbi:hypothetical protein [Streptomyces longisporus]|uniref:nSTAND1 domain-containing NTPase n=1 Tax=Streptomyces longisporus TaxID=1948 RepID=UPI003CD06B3B
MVVERLTRARLLTADEEGVRLAHESLITCWGCTAGSRRTANGARSGGGGPIARDSLVSVQRRRCGRSGLGPGLPSHPGPGVVAR